MQEGFEDFTADVASPSSAQLPAAPSFSGYTRCSNGDSAKHEAMDVMLRSSRKLWEIRVLTLT